MGPNLFSAHEGALLHVALAEGEGAAHLLAWRTMARLLAARLGWPAREPLVRVHPGGAQCFLEAPIDALLTATEVNEQGWLAGERVVAGEAPRELGDVVARLRVHAQHERAPALVALQAAAQARALTFTFDDDDISLGAGTGRRTFPRSALPAPGEVDWSALHDIPIALVTGSNGKTTTTRLLAAMLDRAGYVPGYTSTDGVWGAGQEVDHGDYSGPAGARLVLRDRRVSAAVLETARGGMLRRGLAINRAQVAIVTRVSADHMGEYGIHTLDDLADVKLIVARALVDGARLVLNGEDETLVRLAPSLRVPVTWFVLDATAPVVAAHRAQGGDACVLRDGELRYLTGNDDISLGPVAGMPLTLGGGAAYNVANALAAAAAALALQLPVDAVRDTLARFGAAPDDNPGRLSLLEYRGARVVVDFAHNPDGWLALAGAMRSFPAKRRMVVVGQGGDRDDQALDDLAAAIWQEHPDLIILKEMPKYLRGRAPGQVTARLGEAFVQLGASPDSLRFVDGEMEAIELALAELRPGDLLILSVHTDYAGAMRRLGESGATPFTGPVAGASSGAPSSP